MKSYLALGDSYTIGEAIPFHLNFPNRIVDLLRNGGHAASAPEVIAKTGWTSGELLTAIGDHTFLPSYDFTTLLIGVNNQYRGYPVKDFGKDLESLSDFCLSKLVSPKRLMMVSIPDWGISEFAKDRDRKAIAVEIDRFNEAVRKRAESVGAVYVDITSSQRRRTDAKYFANDHLHPSESEYRFWADALYEHVLKMNQP